MVMKLWRDQVVKECNEFERSFEAFVSSLMHLRSLVQKLSRTLDNTLDYKTVAAVGST